VIALPKKKKENLGGVDLFDRLSNEVNARQAPFGLLCINFPAETITTFRALFFRFHGKTLAGIQLTEPHGVQDFQAIAGGENIGDRTADQVLGAVAEIGKERFVAKYQFSFLIDKRPKRLRVVAHRKMDGLNGL
jgi:hypothetical protein